MTLDGRKDAELIIFDCDGVLVDSEVVVIEIESELLTNAGFPMTPDEIADTCVGLSYGDMMELLRERFGKSVPDGLNEQIQTAALAAFPAQLDSVVGIPDLLAASSRPRCIASSSNLDRIHLSLGLTGLDQYFAKGSIFSAEMVSRGKPEPDLFLHAAHNMAFGPSRCLVIEDSPHGVSAAIAAGMHVVGFAGGRHARPSLVDRLQDAGAPIVVQSAAELAPYVNG